MGLQIINLETAPERTFLLQESAIPARARWQVQIARQSGLPVPMESLPRLLAGFVAFLAKGVPDDLTVLRLPPEGKVLRWRLSLDQQPESAFITLEAWDDVALDGDAARWEPVFATQDEVWRVFACFAYHLHGSH